MTVVVVVLPAGVVGAILRVDNEVLMVIELEAVLRTVVVDLLVVRIVVDFLDAIVVEDLVVVGLKAFPRPVVALLVVEIVEGFLEVATVEDLLVRVVTLVLGVPEFCKDFVF